MSLITLALVIIVVGVLLWLVNTYVPMAGSIKTILNVLVIIFLVIWILSTLGLISGLNLKLK